MRSPLVALRRLHSLTVVTTQIRFHLAADFDLRHGGYFQQVCFMMLRSEVEGSGSLAK